MMRFSRPRVRERLCMALRRGEGVSVGQKEPPELVVVPVVLSLYSLW